MPKTWDYEGRVIEAMADQDRKLNAALVELEDVRHALQWACEYIAHDEPATENGEIRENYTGATRLAWPHNPENWAPEDAR